MNALLKGTSKNPQAIKVNSNKSNYLKTWGVTNQSYTYTSFQASNCFFFKMSLKGLRWWHSGLESTYQCRGHRFKPWSRKIPYAMEQLSVCATTTEPALQSTQATTTEPRATTTEAYAPRAMLRNKRSHHNEKPACRNEEQPPLTATRENTRTATKTQCSQK